MQSVVFDQTRNNDCSVPKRRNAFSRLIFQPCKKPFVAFCHYIIETKIGKFHLEICLQIFDLLSKYLFRLSIIVIGNYCFGLKNDAYYYKFTIYMLSIVFVQARKIAKRREHPKDAMKFAQRASEIQRGWMKSAVRMKCLRCKRDKYFVGDGALDVPRSLF